MPLRPEIWLTKFSQSFPEATLRLLTDVPEDGRALELAEVRAENPDTVASVIRTHPDIFRVRSVVQWRPTHHRAIRG